MDNFAELERRVFKILELDPTNPNISNTKTIQLLSIRSTIAVLAEYEKMKKENQ